MEIVLVYISVLVLIIFLACALLAWKYERDRADEAVNRALRHAQQELTIWKGLAEKDFRARLEKEIRKDAIKRSTAAVSGKVAEQMVPLTVHFEYNPRDVRFLGSPLDLIIFDGLSTGHVDQIVFVEVKTGRSALTRREKEVQKCVERGDVFYEVMRPDQKKEDTSENDIL